jgi:hypothetical protein
MIETGLLLGSKGISPAQRMQLCREQRFVGIDVPYPGQELLVQQ